MHGRKGEVEIRRRRHMWTEPPLGPTLLASPSSRDSLFKDGRKVSIGDCALIQSGNSPPFIGIIRSLALDEGGTLLKLSVNWLYRPGDIKLSKGTLLEAAPNEVFYSFHKDEISSASLLHPCKVAFLRKDAELPPGISSFVCRRVYDIANKRLWWLTDQDYIHERQEEVDHLLDKTRLEMHAAVQSGGRSPKSLNGPTSTQQLKSGSENSGFNSSTSVPHQGKDKKREKGDQGVENLKREKLSKLDEEDPSFKESSIKFEIAEITDKEGGLVNFEAVDKLVQLMQLDRVERKINLTGRMMLADVIAATDNNDCLFQFVQLRGVPVLDDWLQEAHKGKIGEGSSPRENDKSIDALLLSLLRALDKLPVNLHALQTCNVGKSVNHLRSHKNLEIQKKAKSLVDTWKRRVEAEMKINDAKSGQNQTGSWPGKPGGPDVYHGGIGNRRTVCSSEAVVKSSVTQQSMSKAAVKVGHVDPGVKSPSSSSPGSLKLTASLPSSAVMISKQGTDIHLTPLKEDRSSSSSQSQSNSQSCSCDHAKNVSSVCKDDARSTNAGPNNACKKSNSSHSRKSSSGYVNSAVSGVSKAGNVKGGAKFPLPDKVSQSGLMSDLAVVDHGNSQRLIVRLPRSISGGSVEDPSATGGRASSPVVSEKIESHDRKIRGKGDSSRSSNTGDAINESWQRNDPKGGFGCSDERDGSPSRLPDDLHNKTAEESVKSINGYRGVHPSSENEGCCILPDGKLIKRFESSLSSINALIESCVKDSQDTNAPLPVGDETGMNLLASVAAGEMSKSELTCTNSSPGKNSPTADDDPEKQDEKLRLSFLDSLPEVQDRLDESPSKLGIEGPSLEGASPIEAGMRKSPSCVSSNHASSGGNRNSKLSENSCLRVQNLQTIEDETNMYEMKADEMTQHGQITCLSSSEAERASSVDRKDVMEAHVGHELLEEDTNNDNHHGYVEANMREEIVEGKQVENNVCEAFTSGDTAPSTNGNAHGNNGSVSCTKVETGDENLESPIESGRIDVKSRIDKSVEQDLSFGARCLSEVDAAGKSTSSSEGVKVEIDEDSLRVSHLSSANENLHDLVVIPGIPDERVKEDSESKENVEHSQERMVIDHRLSPPVSDMCLNSMKSKLSDREAVDVANHLSNDECSASVLETEAKVEFDLNEEFPQDEGSQQDVVTSATSSRSSSLIHLHGPLTFSVAPSTSLPASITITAAAKGPFLPPEDLLRSKGELGWKGSAATSAFRRAEPREPRKLLETSLSTAEVLNSESCTGRKGRPWLDFDLNVPDDGVFKDTPLQSSVPAICESRPARNFATLQNTGSLDLDLNRVDESSEQSMQLQPNVSRRLEVFPVTSEASSSGFVTEANVLRDFDLNDGPGVDEAAVMDSISRNHRQNSSVPFMPGISGVRLNSAELGGLSSWLPGSSYPAMAIQSFLPDRGEQQPFSIVTTGGGHQRILGPVSGGAFGADVYPAPVLSSSPMPYSAASSPFPYAGFHFGASFPVPSTSFSVTSSTITDSSVGGSSCFPAVPSQLAGPGGTISTHYSRPYVISRPDTITASGVSDNNRKWNRQGCLDLNTGPGGTDGEARDERLQQHSTRQISVGGSQGLIDEEGRMYHAVKRKEPEGGWDADRLNYKQPSWQ